MVVRDVRPRERDAGLTVVELLVTLTILSVVLASLTAGAITILRATNHVTLHTDDQNEARTAIAVLSRDVRAASPVRPSTDPAFLVATPDEAQFTANLQDTTRPLLVRLFVDEDSRLIEDATPPDPGTTTDGGLTWDPATNANIRYIAAFVVNDASLPLFTYYDANGAELPYSTEDDCPGPDGDDIAAPCLMPDDRARIALVGISLTISSDPGDRVRQFTVAQRVRLPNAGG